VTIKPSDSANVLHLNITDDDNSLDYDLTMDVIDFFQLGKEEEAETIKDDVLTAVSTWETVAKYIGISRSEQQLMAAAFNV
jgi:serine/threonine-protein kinase HipA